MANRRFLTDEELRECLVRANGIVFTPEWEKKNGPPQTPILTAYDAITSILLHHLIQRKLADINEA